MLPIYFLNGKQYATSEALADVRDRGLAYGDGAFETIRFTHGRLPFWPQHKARLLKGVDHLGISLSEEKLEQQLATVLQQLKTVRDDCVVKLMVTRGVSSRGYMPADSSPTVVFIINPLVVNELSQQGCSVHLCKEVLAEPLSWAGLKTLNQLSYVLASRERANTTFDEGLISSSQGHIIEATARNLFCIRDNILLTPDLSTCGVAGVMREMIIQRFAPALNLNVNILKLSIADLLAADEVFVCNSVTGLWPVTHFSDIQSNHYWSIGKVTVQLQDLIKEFIQQI